MPYQPPIRYSNLAQQKVHCPACSWKGKALDAVVKINEIVRCPRCGKPVEKDTP